MSMTMSHVFVEGCIVPMDGGLSAPMSVYVPKAALTVVQMVGSADVLSNEHGVVAERADLTLEERKKQRERLLKWVELETRKIAVMETAELVRTEQMRTEQVRTEQVEEQTQDDDSEADDDSHVETLEEATARRKEEDRKAAANKRSNAKRERAAKCFDALPLGARLRNRQELNGGVKDYLDCKKAANQGERRMCEYDGRLLSLRAFAIMHREALKTAGKINRDIKGDPLDTMECFRQRKNKFCSLSAK